MPDSGLGPAQWRVIIIVAFSAAVCSAHVSVPPRSYLASRSDQCCPTDGGLCIYRARAHPGMHQSQKRTGGPTRSEAHTTLSEML